MAESGYGLAGLGMGKVKSINQYRLTPGFGGFTPVSHVTTACRLPCRWRGICRQYSYLCLIVFKATFFLELLSLIRDNMQG
ncbi:hypothetical protein QNY26_004564 [Escherichia coli]|nr:hypothetical protein [Escherichia coli]EII7070997.1 hypothetical protein [Escherichia coli]ELV6159053.1 hypothetical protein [Escherichia coli]